VEKEKSGPKKKKETKRNVRFFVGEVLSARPWRKGGGGVKLGKTQEKGF